MGGRAPASASSGCARTPGSTPRGWRIEAGRYAEAGELAEAALGDDPFRESAWRLRMQIAGIVGDEDGVIAAYRGCADALDTLGARPSDATRGLLESLRR